MRWLTAELIEPPAPNLPAELGQLIRQIPADRVSSCGNLGRALGDVVAARWIGTWLRNHDHDSTCPCHRVVLETGASAESCVPLEQRIALLQAEQVPLTGGRVDLARCRFTDFVTSRPLRQLLDFQNDLHRHLDLRDYPETPELIAGVDLSYVGDSHAVAAYCLVEFATGRLVWSTTVLKEIAFPYIPGFLASRELPALRELIAQVRCANRLADVVLVDGNGILHHRRAGIAVPLGLLENLRTLGVSKKLLCGQVNEDEMTPDEPRPISHRGEIVGQALVASARSRPVYVSPGHLISVTDATRLTRQLFHGHRIPEPTFHADALSRKVAQEIKAGGDVSAG